MQERLFGRSQPERFTKLLLGLSQHPSNLPEFWRPKLLLLQYVVQVPLRRPPVYHIVLQSRGAPIHTCTHMMSRVGLHFGPAPHRPMRLIRLPSAPKFTVLSLSIETETNAAIDFLFLYGGVGDSE
jgi:hypothetical protein